MSVELRASEALRLWHQVSLEGVRSESPDLTQRQTAILLTVYLEAPPHTVRDLAKRQEGHQSCSHRTLQANEETLVDSTKLHIEAGKTQRGTGHINEAGSPARLSQRGQRPTEHDE